MLLVLVLSLLTSLSPASAQEDDFIDISPPPGPNDAEPPLAVDYQECPEWTPCPECPVCSPCVQEPGDCSLDTILITVVVFLLFIIGILSVVLFKRRSIDTSDLSPPPRPPEPGGTLIKRREPVIDQSYSRLRVAPDNNLPLPEVSLPPPSNLKPRITDSFLPTPEETLSPSDGRPLGGDEVMVPSGDDFAPPFDPPVNNVDSSLTDSTSSEPEEDAHPLLEAIFPPELPTPTNVAAPRVMPKAPLNKELLRQAKAAAIELKLKGASNHDISSELADMGYGEAFISEALKEFS